VRGPDSNLFRKILPITWTDRLRFSFLVPGNEKGRRKAVARLREHDETRIVFQVFQKKPRPGDGRGHKTTRERAA
jgi:hypothetical protein